MDGIIRCKVTSVVECNMHFIQYLLISCFPYVPKYPDNNHESELWMIYIFPEANTTIVCRTKRQIDIERRAERLYDCFKRRAI